MKSKQKHQVHPVYEETDKYREKEGRIAAEEEKDTEFLDHDALDEDLVSKEEVAGDSAIVDSDHPENQEWHAREAQNADNPDPEAAHPPHP